MSFDPQESNIADIFRVIHNLISRGVKVSMESVRTELIQGHLEDGGREGLFNYIRALSSVLTAHHLSEDEHAFPYFRNKMPGAPFDDLAEWHQEMEKILVEIKGSVDKCERNDQLVANLKDLENALSRLDGEWQPHIQVEKDEFVSKADALVPVEDQRSFVKIFVEYGLKLALPDYLTVPFMLYNLSEEERSIFSQWLPSEVIRDFVPGAWKEKWESMAPYLLS